MMFNDYKHWRNAKYQKEEAWWSFHPHHIIAGRQFEQDSAVLVELLQRPVQQGNQINTPTDRLTKLSE